MENNEGILIGISTDLSTQSIANALQSMFPNDPNITEPMEKNEIKKALYKQNPKAKLVRVYKEYLYYGCFVELEDRSLQEVVFIIPFSDIGDASFWRDEDAKLLIRWII